MGRQDRDFVLKEITELWPNPVGNEGSYADFNKYVRTTVATRLDTMLWWQEVKTYAVGICIWISMIASVAVGMASVSGQLKPVMIWPTFWTDWSSLISPDDCPGAAHCFSSG